MSYPFRDFRTWEATHAILRQTKQDTRQKHIKDKTLPIFKNETFCGIYHCIPSPEKLWAQWRYHDRYPMGSASFPIGETLLLIVSLMGCLTPWRWYQSYGKANSLLIGRAPHNGNSSMVQNFTWDPVKKDIPVTKCCGDIISHGKRHYTCVLVSRILQETARSI